MYITHEEYTNLYDPVDNFDVLCHEACIYIDQLTTGVDGVKKLKIAFPADKDSETAVKFCTAKIINILSQIQDAEKAAALGSGYTQTEQGIHGNVITSVSSGNESISYSTAKSQNTAIFAAVEDTSAKNKLIINTVRRYLSGIQDANGVNLLYLGAYPRRSICL